jgi:hypothetical protein
MLKRYTRWLQDLGVENELLRISFAAMTEEQQREQLKQSAIAIRKHYGHLPREERDKRIKFFVQLYLKAVFENAMGDSLVEDWSERKDGKTFWQVKDSGYAEEIKQAKDAYDAALAACAQSAMELYPLLCQNTSWELEETKKVLLRAVAHRLRDEQDEEKLEQLFAFFVNPSTLSGGDDAKYAYKVLCETITALQMGLHWTLDRAIRFLRAVPENHGRWEESDKQRREYLVRGFMRIYIHYAWPSDIVAEVTLGSLLHPHLGELSAAGMSFLAAQGKRAIELDNATALLHEMCTHVPRHEEPDRRIPGEITFEYRPDGSIVMRITQDTYQRLDALDVQESYLMQYVAAWHEQHPFTVHLEWFTAKSDGTMPLEPLRRSFDPPAQ